MASIIAKLQLKDGSELELDKSWLKSLNIKRQSNTQVGSIFYGVVPAQGTVDVIDKDGSIIKHIQDGLLDNNGAKINIYFNNKIIGKLVSSSSKYDDQNNILSIQCTDELDRFSKISYPYRQMTNGSQARELLVDILHNAGYERDDVLKMLSSPLTRYKYTHINNLDDLSACYQLNMAYLYGGTVADQLNKVCNVLQTSLIQTGAELKFIDMSLDYNPNIDYINIPFKNQYSLQDISLFKSNKVDKVIIDNITLSSTVGNRLNIGGIEVYKDNAYVWTSSENNPTAYEYSEIQDMSDEYTGAYSKLVIPDVVIDPEDVITNQQDLTMDFAITASYTLDPDNTNKNIARTQRFVARLNLGGPPPVNVYRWTRDIYVDEDHGTEGPDKIHGIPYSLNMPYYFKLVMLPIASNDDRLHYSMTLYFIGRLATEGTASSGATGESTVFNTINTIGLSLDKSDFISSRKSSQSTEGTFQYLVNELMTYDSTATDDQGNPLSNVTIDTYGTGDDDQEVADVMSYISNTLTNAYKDGLYTCKITINCDDYYDENGNKIKDASQGQLIELNDTIRIDHKKDLFNNMLWRVTGVNFRYDGRPLIDLELVEMRIEKPSVKIINGNYHVHSSIGELDGDIYFIGYMGTLENQHHELIKYEPDKDLLSSLLVLNDNYLNANDFYNVIDRCKYLSSDGNMKSCLINFGTEYAYIISKDNDSVYANYYNEKLPYRDLYYIPKPPLNLEGATITNVKNDYYIQLQTERSEHAAISEIRHTRSVPISTLYGDYSTKVFWASEKASSEYVLFCRDGIGYLESDDKLYVVKYSGNSEPQIQESTIEEFFNLDPMFAVLFNVYVDNDDNANSLYKGGQNLIVIADRDIFYIVEYDEFFANKTLHKYENPTIDGVKQIVVGIAKIGDWYFVACHNKTFADDYPIQILYGKSLDKLEFLGSALKGRTTAYSYPVEFKLINDYLYVVDPYGSNRPDLHDELAAIRIPPYIKKVDKNT